MCFSATASFIAGGSLSAFGVATVAKAKRRSEVPFAAIPLLFGIQQIIEGIIWVTLDRNAPVLRQSMTYVYSMFSHVLWPIYIPFAFRFLETTAWRRHAMLWFQAAGIVVGVFLLSFIVTGPVAATAVGQHIVYESPHFLRVPVMALYLLATCVTGFVSSHTFVRLFGALSLLSYVAAYLFATQAVISVWCFFAAVLSLMIYAHLRFRNLGGFPLSASPLSYRAAD